MHEHGQPGGLLQLFLPLAIFAVVFAFRMRGMARERPLKLERLWIVPAIYLALVAVTFAATPPTPSGWAVAFAALVIGAAIGWQRGKTMRITLDPATHRLSQKASPLAMLLLVAIVGIRAVLRTEGARFGFDAMLLTDALLAFALGLFAATRAEMFLRGKRILAQATGSPVA